jgi:hypothetical protein
MVFSELSKYIVLFPIGSIFYYMNIITKRLSFSRIFTQLGLNLPKHSTLDIDILFLFQYINNSISLIKANVNRPSHKEGLHVWLERNPILPSQPYLPKMEVFYLLEIRLRPVLFILAILVSLNRG